MTHTEKTPLPQCLLGLHYPLIAWVFAVAQQVQGQAVLVGGAVRQLLQQPTAVPDDFDFLVLNVDAHALAQALTQAPCPLALARPVRLVTLDAQWGIYRLVVWLAIPPQAMPPITLDLANALNNHLHSDLARRDLTINAIGWNGHHFIDPHHGRRDLRTQTVRMVSAQNLTDDPLRVLRVFRTASGLPNPTLDPATLAACYPLAGAMGAVAPERITTEWLKLLAAPWQPLLPLVAHMPPALLARMVPELTPAQAQDTLACLQNGLSQCPLLQQWITHAQATQPEYMALLRWLLLWGAHVALNNSQAWPACGVLQWPVPKWVNQQVPGWWALLAQHPNITWPPVQQPPHIPAYAPSHWAFWRQHGGAIPPVLVLALAWGWLTPAQAQAQYRAWQHAHAVAQATPPLLTGKQLMAQSGMVPGPHIQHGLNNIRDAQLAGLLTTPTQALTWLEQQQTICE
jgi:tRNA nucleotidyltransferase (CCA-adding enzyme)